MRDFYFQCHLAKHVWSLSERSDSALQFDRFESLASELFDSLQEPLEKTQKKACQKFLHPINPWGNHTQFGRSVDGRVAVPL